MSVEPILAANSSWFTQGGTTVKRSSITEIEIKDSYTPAGAVTASWDASAAKDGSVMAYVEGTKLIIAGNGSGKVFANADFSYTFSDKNKADYFENVTAIIGGAFLDTSKATNMTGTFNKCYSLSEVDVSTWDTSDVTLMQATFNSCYALPFVDVSGFNTSKVTAMTSMFQHCLTLERLDLSAWDVSNVTNMSFMFATTSSTLTGQMKLSTIGDVGEWNVSSVANMSTMFQLCTQLKELNAGNWDTSACTKMDYMFNGCNSLQKILVSNTWTVEQVTNSIRMFDKCETLVGGSGTIYDAIYIDKSRAIIDNGDSTKGYLTYIGKDFLTDTHSIWTIADAVRAITGENTMYSIYEMVSALRGYPILASQNNWYKSTSVPIADITNLNIISTYTVSGAENEVWNADVNNSGSILCYRTGTELTLVPIGKSKVRLHGDSANVFGNMSSLTTITGLTCVDVSGVTSMRSAFENDGLLTNIDAPTWTFSTANDTDSMFANCHSLVNVNIGTGLTTLGSRMFYKCVELQTVRGLSKAKTVGDRTFLYTPNLISVDLSPYRIVNIGESACRLSSIEDCVDLSVVPVNVVGAYATRNKRWDEDTLTSLQNIRPTQYVFVDVPNPDNQENYDYHYATLSNGEERSVARGACMAFVLYHAWNAMTTTTPYDNWEDWWYGEIEEAYKLTDRYVEGETFIGDNNGKTWSDFNFMVELLGWTRSDYYYITGSAAKTAIINRIVQGLPLYASMDSSNSTTGEHAIAIIGCDPVTGKLAICDSAVYRPDGIISWFAFEDIFAKDSNDMYIMFDF